MTKCGCRSVSCLIILVALVFSAAAYQRGANAGAPIKGDCPDGQPLGAAGLDRSLPCPGQTLPPGSNPNVRAELDREQNIKDAEHLAILANDLKLELQRDGSLKLSLTSLKMADDLEKLSKKLHDRMKSKNR